MGDNAVKGVVTIMLLVILSVIIGVQISGGIKESLGAFAVIAAIIGGFFILLMGKRLWFILFLLPPFIRLIPIPILSIFHPSQLLSFPVLIVWCLMWMLRQTNFKWRSLPVLDCACITLVMYMAISYYRHPTAINILGIDLDYVGGKEYAYCIMALVHYVTLSALPIQSSDLRKVLKWAFYCSLIMGFYGAFAGMFNLAGGVQSAEGTRESVLDTYSHGRFDYFTQIGAFIVTYFYARYPLRALISSFSRLLPALLGFTAILISGWRGSLVSISVNLFTLALAKRELLILFIGGIMTYGTLFGLSSLNAFVDAPYGMQRVVMLLPGMHVSSQAEEDTTSSSEIRKRMWRRAMDPHTGLIKDYIWGDGYQTSKSMLMRQTTAYLRTGYSDMQAILESHGDWHNGMVTYIHRLGYIGAVLIHLVLLIAAFYAIQVLRVLAGTPDGGYVAPYCLGFFAHLYASSFMTYTVLTLFYAFPSIACSKILYCMLRDEGKIQPFFRNERYIPLSIRELESSKNPI